MGIEIDVVEVHGAQDYDGAFAKAAQRAPAVFVNANPTFAVDVRLIAAAAVKHRVAVLCEWREMAEAGCLVSYGPTLRDLQLRAATFVDRILRGARPSDLPVEQPDRFELAFNLGTAKALGVTIPKSLLQQATAVY